MSNDGTGLRVDVHALAQEIRRVDGSHSLGAGALAEALTPYVAALSAVAPPPVLEGVSVAQATAPERIWLAVSDDTFDAEHPFPGSGDWEHVCWSADAPLEVCVPYIRADLAASPAAPAQPEGGEAVAWAVINHCDNDKVGIAFEKPGAEWFARVGAAYSVRPLVYGDTRPASAQQAVTDDDAPDWAIAAVARNLAASRMDANSFTAAMQGKALIAAARALASNAATAAHPQGVRLHPDLQEQPR